MTRPSQPVYDVGFARLIVKPHVPEELLSEKADELRIRVLKLRSITHVILRDDARVEVWRSLDEQLGRWPSDTIEAITTAFKAVFFQYYFGGEHPLPRLFVKKGVGNPDRVLEVEATFRLGNKLMDVLMPSWDSPYLDSLTDTQRQFLEVMNESPGINRIAFAPYGMRLMWEPRFHVDKRRVIEALRLCYDVDVVDETMPEHGNALSSHRRK